MKKTRRSLCCLMALLCAVLLGAVRVGAAQKQTVNVGYYLYDNFQERSSDGEYSGYAYDYYKQIAKYTDWQYNFKLDGIADCFQMLLSGEVDMMFGVDPDALPEGMLLYSEYPVTTTQAELYARGEDDTVYYESYEEFDGKRVAVLKGNNQTPKLIDYCNKHNFELELVDTYTQLSEMEQALADGSVDLIFSSNVSKMGDVKIVAKFEIVNLYLAVTPQRADLLEQLNDALWQIQNINPGFSNELAKKYGNVSKTVIPAFSKSELEFIEAKPEIAVIINADWQPISWYNQKQGRCEGIAVDLFRKISEHSGLRFHYYTMEEFAAQEKQNPDISKYAMMLLSNDNHWGDLKNVYLSNTVLDSPVVMISKSQALDMNTARIAMPKEFYTTWRLSRQVAPDRITLYDTVEQCLDAVAKGKAELTYVNHVVANHYLPYVQYRSLFALTMTNFSENLAIAINQDAGRDLLSIVNKSLLSISEEEINGFIMKNSIMDDDYNLNLLALGGSISSIALFVIVILKLFYDKRQNRLLSQKNAQLSDAVKQAEQATRAKSQFLSHMSHEIRTPMNAIVGLTSLAQNIGENPPKTQEYLAKIDTSSKLLLSIINDVLDMSAIESQKLQIANTTFDFKSLVLSISNLYYTQCSQKGISFQIRCSELCPEALVGDALRVNQILLNLLSNAYKFTKPGGEITVSVAPTTQKEKKIFLRFIVSDTGCGMSQEMLGRLFEPFEQESANTARNYGGSGLGMSITKNLIDLMQGAIKVESAVGKGTTFTVDLPFGKSDEVLVADPDQLRDLHVLIVDDERDQRSYAARVLQSMGVSFETVASGAQAIAAIEEAARKNFCYDVCLMDWKMPRTSGLEAVREIRSIASADTLIIVVSAYDVSELQEEAKAAGVNTVIAKPVFPSVLFNTLMSIKEKSKTAQDEQNEEYSFVGKRVLLAEDFALNREVALDLLEVVHLQADCAEDGRQALDLFLRSAEGAYDLILMDVQMPEMDGYEATRRIRASEHPQAKTIPIFAMTANAFSEDVSAALSAGMNGHIAKPIDTKALYALLKQYL